MDAREIAGLGSGLMEFLATFDDCFGRSEPREHLRTYVSGQLSDLRRKSLEPIALSADVPPRTLQRFFELVEWDEVRLRDKLQRVVARDHADAEAIGIIDETGHPKKGKHTAGVKRQWCGNTGKLDNCVVSVHTGYVSGDFQCLLDSDVYLPKEWAEDRPRRLAAHIPDEVVFRTKPELALELIRGAAPKIRHGWVTFDEGYGKDPGFVSGLEEMGERYIGEVPKTCRGWLDRPKVQEPQGRRRQPRVAPGQAKPQTVEEIASSLPASSWKRLQFREGTKGTQVAHFARVRFVAERDDLPGPELWLMIERSCDQAPYVKYYLSNAAPDCALLEMAQAGHNRWPVEDCFLRGKQEVGLDDYEVRGWRGWHHHMTLVMLALWFLVLQKRRLGKKNQDRHDVA